MIEIKQGDILKADAEALVNTVNCVGVMGRGIALQFKKAFPDNYRKYKAVCDRKGLQPGAMFVHRRDNLFNPKYVINFPTKRHWKGKSRMEDIETGLQTLVEEVRSRNIRSIAIPPLGCGLGGLPWNAVRRRIEAAFQELPDVQVLLYEPLGAPEPKRMVKTKKTPNMTVGRAALLGLMRKYLAAVMDPSISLLEIHKLMYFMQEAEEPLKLEFQKGPYGPYARNLRHVLNYIEGHFITGFGDAEDKPERQIELNRNVTSQVDPFLRKHPETNQRFLKVTDLISGFETPFGMELLSTVHWVARREGAVSSEEALAKTHAWNSRKKMFTQRHVSIAWETLAEKGWLNTDHENLKYQ